MLFQPARKRVNGVQKVDVDIYLMFLILGFYCTSGVNVSAPDQHFTGIGGKCLVGHECPEGSSTIHPCDPGYYAAVEGMSACDVCPAGA